MRRLAGYLLLLLGLAMGLDVRITEPPLLFIGGIVVTVLMFWGARALLSPEQSHR